MKKWLRRIRGAVGMGLTWAAGWAAAGVLIGVASVLLPFLPWHWFFEVFDAPLPALAVPGFFGGVFFSMVLGIAARRRRFDELSLPRFAALGAVGGLLLTLFPFALVAVGLASLHGSAISAWQALAVLGGPLILLSAVSAAGSLMLARRAENRDLLESQKGNEADSLPFIDAGGTRIAGLRLPPPPREAVATAAEHKDHQEHDDER